MGKFEIECTRTCRSKQHGSQIAAAIIRGTDEEAIAYMKTRCHKYYDVVDKNGNTALHTAAACGKYKVVKWLLHNGASKNQKDLESGYTALHKALFHGHINVACLLLQHGCSITSLDYDSLAAFDHIIKDRPLHMTYKGHAYVNQVYVWGSNSNFNLGQISQKETAELCELSSRDSQSFVDVSMNKFHTLFLSSVGSAYACGHALGGRLGIDTEEPVIKPMLIKAFIPYTVKQLSAGYHHSLFLLDGGQVWTCGQNMYHQLGISPPPESISLPRPVTWPKSRKETTICGIGAARYHSIMWTKQEVFTFGLNAGQLGHIKNDKERTVITPRVVTAINLKGEGHIECVGYSNAATVIVTSKGDVYVISGYKTRRVASKMIGIVKVTCTGGSLDATIGEDKLKNGGGGPLTILVLVKTGFIYMWTERSKMLCRCIYTINREILVIDMCLNKENICLVTNTAEAYVASVLPPREYKKDKQDGSNAALELPTKKNTEVLKLARLSGLHRTVKIACDPKGSNYMAIQNDPRTFLIEVVEPKSYSFLDDMKALLEQTTEDDFVHDCLLLCKGHVFAAHSYILAESSEYFKQLILDWHKEQESAELSYKCKAKLHIDLSTLPGEIIKHFLMFMYYQSFDVALITSKLAELTFEGLELFQLKPEKVKRRSSQRDMGGKVSNAAGSLQVATKLASKLGIASMVSYLERISTPARITVGALLCGKSRCSNERIMKINFKRNHLSQLWDVEIRSDDGHILHAHKCMLVARLEYFRAMFTCGWIESFSSEIMSMPFPSRILRIVLDFLYEDQSSELSVCHDTELVCQVLVAADHLLIGALKETCEMVLAGLLTLRNTIELLEFAWIYNADNLKRVIFEFICINLITFFENGSLLSLSEKMLGELSQYYRKMIPQMERRVVTPFDEPPFAEELERLHKMVPVMLSESEDESWQEVKDDTKSASKNRRHRYGHRRLRRPSASSHTSVNSDGEVSGELDDSLEVSGELDDSLSFDDLIERNSKNTSKDSERATQKSPLAEDPWRKVARKMKDDKRAPVAHAMSAPKKNLSDSVISVSQIKSVLDEEPVIPQPTHVTFADAFSVAFKNKETASAGALGKSKGRLSQKERKRNLLSAGEVKKSQSLPLVDPHGQRKDSACNHQLKSSSVEELLKQPKSSEVAIPKSQSHSDPQTAPSESVSPSSCEAASFWELKSPSTPKFSDILQEERKHTVNLVQQRDKPLALIQLEDRAIEDLLQFYGATSSFEEQISVVRVTKGVAEPTWRRSRLSI